MHVKELWSENRRSEEGSGMLELSEFLPLETGTEVAALGAPLCMVSQF